MSGALLVLQFGARVVQHNDEIAIEDELLQHAIPVLFRALLQREHIAQRIGNGRSNGGGEDDRDAFVFPRCEFLTHDFRLKILNNVPDVIRV